ncbi:hypothetical protein MPSEU_000874600 [Mayamaea pseudoterrestris]|nr:hypothetical protein MPSEU_000874600 [Mayamaea pseudoterrestris]
MALTERRSSVVRSIDEDDGIILLDDSFIRNDFSSRSWNDEPAGEFINLKQSSQKRRKQVIKSSKSSSSDGATCRDGMIIWSIVFILAGFVVGILMERRNPNILIKTMVKDTTSQVTGGGMTSESSNGVPQIIATDAPYPAPIAPPPAPVTVALPALEPAVVAPPVSQPAIETDTATIALSASTRWPQRDSRIRDAMTQGTRIASNQHEAFAAGPNDPYYTFNNVRYEAPPPKLATVVTAMYDLASNSKHTRQEYETWLDLLLVCTSPMVIFVDEQYLEYVKERRQHAPTLVALLSFDAITMASTFSDDFWKNEVLPLDGDPATALIDVYKIRNEQMIFMHEVALYNPFETELFFWCDASYFRHNHWHSRNIPVIRNNITAHNVPLHQGLFLKPYPEHNQLGGGLWGAHGKAMPDLYEAYFETFWYMAKHKLPFIGNDDKIMTFMCQSFPDLCKVVVGNGDLRLFGHNFLRSVTLPFDPAPVSLQVEGQALVELPVDFPTLTNVITSSEAV